MTYGTSYFVSFEAAERYFADYEPNPRSAVARMVCDFQIHIGKPMLKVGETLSIIDNGTRYAITDDTVVSTGGPK